MNWTRHYKADFSARTLLVAQFGSKGVTLMTRSPSSRLGTGDCAVSIILASDCLSESSTAPSFADLRYAPFSKTCEILGKRCEGACNNRSFHWGMLKVSNSCLSRLCCVSIIKAKRHLLHTNKRQVKTGFRQNDGGRFLNVTIALR